MLPVYCELACALICPRLRLPTPPTGTSRVPRPPLGRSMATAWRDESLPVNSASRPRGPTSSGRFCLPDSTPTPSPPNTAPYSPRRALRLPQTSSACRSWAAELPCASSRTTIRSHQEAPASPKLGSMLNAPLGSRSIPPTAKGLTPTSSSPYPRTHPTPTANLAWLAGSASAKFASMTARSIHPRAWLSSPRPRR